MGRQSKKEQREKIAAYRKELRPIALKILYDEYKAGVLLTDTQLQALHDAGYEVDNS